MKQLKRLYHKYYHNISRVCFPVVLFLYPFCTVNQGVDVSDSTYSLANFLYFPQMKGTWVISTYVANAAGWLLTKLPGGETLLGMNIYTTLAVSATVLFVYSRLRRWMPAWIVFVGEIIAVGFCWIPTGILYNYLTYLFFTLGAVFLYQGLVEEKDSCLLAAGFFLGFNVFVRIPNLTQMSLILGLWYYLKEKKQTALQIVQKTGICAAGYLAGAVLPLCMVLWQYGLTGLGDMITGLVSMQNTDSTYSAAGMAAMTVSAYGRTLKWVWFIVIYVCMGMAAFMGSGKIKHKVANVGLWLRILYGAGMIVLLRFFWGRGMFSFRYYEDYSSMYEWGMIGLYMVWGAGIHMIFSRKSSLEERLLAVTNLVILAVTPLGSNNYTFQNLNNLFLTAPFGLYAFVKMYRRKAVRETTKQMEFCFKSMAAVLGAMILLQSIGFHSQFSFRDGMDGSSRSYRFREGVAAGMYTTEKNGRELASVMEYMEDSGIKQKKAIFFGDCPGLSFLLRMPSAIGTAWPDLDSYGYGVFVSDLDHLSELPVVILRKKENGGEQAEAKKEYLAAFIQKNKYQNVFGSENYAVYAPAGDK